MNVKGETARIFDNDEGITVHDYTHGKETSSSLASIDVMPASRHRLAWSSKSDKYFYVTSGQVHFKVDGVEHDLKDGDFILIKVGQKFEYVNTLHNKVTKLVLVHTPPFDIRAEHFEDNGTGDDIFQS